jgi:hypothetical protein
MAHAAAAIRPAEPDGLQAHAAAKLSELVQPHRPSTDPSPTANRRHLQERFARLLARSGRRTSYLADD